MFSKFLCLFVIAIWRAGIYGFKSEHSASDLLSQNNYFLYQDQKRGIHKTTRCFDLFTLKQFISISGKVLGDDKHFTDIEMLYWKWKFHYCKTFFVSSLLYWCICHFPSQSRCCAKISSLKKFKSYFDVDCSIILKSSLRFFDITIQVRRCCFTLQTEQICCPLLPPFKHNFLPKSSTPKESSIFVFF